MKGYLYILKSEKTGKYYVGSSDNPERRLQTQHNIGFVRSTRSGIPWKLVFKQEYLNLPIARKIEYKLKKLKSRVIIEKIIADNFCKLIG
ncbi:GIY-YIG nuclease family protein [Candidatus Shapirobacteria bacterium]|nr:GIY-YIG nuclease family protein [Candidatus Shapirobacteria bacterium]